MPLGRILPDDEAGWYPDGKRILFVGHEPGRPARCYASDFGRELPRPITPEGVVGKVISPDGRSLITQGPAGVFSVSSLEGGKPVPIPALQSGDSPVLLGIAISRDGRTYVYDYRRALSDLYVVDGLR